jgi:hypothetical protein
LIEGLLCVGGRLDQAPISDKAKHQVILPKNTHIPKLIIANYHLKAGHSGRE